MKCCLKLFGQYFFFRVSVKVAEEIFNDFGSKKRKTFTGGAKSKSYKS